MTSKDRVLSATRRQKGDRPAFQLMGFYEDESLEKMQRHLGVDDAEQVWDTLGIDVRCVYAPWLNAPKHVTDIWDGGGVPYGELAHTRPLHDAETIADVEAFPWPQPDWVDASRFEPQRREHLSRHFVTLSSGPVWCQLARLMSMEPLLIQHEA